MPKLLKKTKQTFFDYVGEAIKKDNEESYSHRDRIYSHPSQVSQCPRSIYLTRCGFQQSANFNYKQLRVFNNGNYVHDRLQNDYITAGILEGFFSCKNPDCTRDLTKLKSRYKKNGLPIILTMYHSKFDRYINWGFTSIRKDTAKVSCIPYHLKSSVSTRSVPYRVKWYANKPEDYVCPMCGLRNIRFDEILIFDPFLGLYGHCDGIINDPIDKKKKLFDIKSSNTFFYSQPVPEHYIEQLQCYLYVLNIEDGMFIFERKDDQDQKIKPYKSDKQIVNSLKSKLLRVENALRNIKKLPIFCKDKPFEYTQKNCYQIANCLGLEKEEFLKKYYEIFGKKGYEHREDIFEEKFEICWRIPISNH